MKTYWIYSFLSLQSLPASGICTLCKVCIYKRKECFIIIPSSEKPNGYCHSPLGHRNAIPVYHTLYTCTQALLVCTESVAWTKFNSRFFFQYARFEWHALIFRIAIVRTGDWVFRVWFQCTFIALHTPSVVSRFFERVLRKVGQHCPPWRGRRAKRRKGFLTRPWRQENFTSILEFYMNTSNKSASFSAF